MLAIDYGVVVKGLQSKFGKMTEENEWEFRAFFDKIIQLPFSMPISSYNISKYLQSLLVDVNYFDRADLENQENLEKIAEIVSLSVGTNPRTLKRLANSVSLIEIIRGDQKISSEERIIEFALICIQIAYPTIYNLISRDPDFVNWDDQMVYSVLKNKKIDTNDLESLKETEDFDEEWEQNLWKICQISTFLKGRAHYLSRLLNFIKDNMPNIKGEEINTTIERLLSMSSVTSVSAEATVTKEKKKRDTSRYSMNGKRKLTKGKIALEIISQYVKDNPASTYDELKELLVNKTNYEKIIIPYEEAVEIKNRDRVRHFVNEDEVLNLANGVKASVTRGWSAGPALDGLLLFAKENGYIVTNS